jgi:hypothetical protein
VLKNLIWSAKVKLLTVPLLQSILLRRVVLGCVVLSRELKTTAILPKVGEVKKGIMNLFLSLALELVVTLTRVELMSNCPSNLKSPLGGSAKT